MAWTDRHRMLDEDLAWLSAQPLPWERFRNKTILVSGAYGFINAYLIEVLLYLNEVQNMNLTVLALCRTPQKAEARFSAYMERKDLQFVYQDVCDPIPDVGPVHFIIHGASWASPKFYGARPAETLMPNTVGTLNLLRFGHSQELEGFLFLSSAEIYGKPPADQIPTPEIYNGNVDPCEVRSCYAESKRMGETMCVAWSEQHDLPTRIARVFHTYGPGMALDDGRVFSDFVSDVITRRNIRMMSDGVHQRTFCYLADAACALFTILLRGEAKLAYNMGNDEAESSIRDLAHTLAGLFPEYGLTVEQVGDTHPKGYIRTTVDRACPDTSRLRSLGWQPHYSIAEGFRRTVLSYVQ